MIPAGSNRARPDTKVERSVRRGGTGRRSIAPILHPNERLGYRPCDASATFPNPCTRRRSVYGSVQRQGFSRRQTFAHATTSRRSHPRSGVRRLDRVPNDTSAYVTRSPGRSCSRRLGRSSACQNCSVSARICCSLPASGSRQRRPRRPSVRRAQNGVDIQSPAALRERFLSRRSGRGIPYRPASRSFPRSTAQSVRSPSRSISD